MEDYKLGAIPVDGLPFLLSAGAMWLQVPNIASSGGFGVWPPIRPRDCFVPQRSSPNQRAIVAVVGDTGRRQV